MLKRIKKLVLGLSLGSSHLLAQYGHIDGPQLMPTAGKAVFEFLHDGPKRNVHWSVVEADGGTLTASGWYLAPEKPGIYHIQCFALERPSQVDKWEVEVRQPSNIHPVWEAYGQIDQGKASIIFINFHLTPKGILERMDWGHKHDAVGDLELASKSGKSVEAPSFFWVHDDRSFEHDTGWMSLIENDNLGEVNRLRLRKNGNPKIVLDEAIDGTLKDQEWKLVQMGEEGQFKYCPNEDWVGVNDPDGRKIGVYVSWDDGKTWQTPGSWRVNLPSNWRQFRLPMGGLLENPNPLIQFEITKGFNRKTRTYSLKEILKKTTATFPTDKSAK